MDAKVAINIGEFDRGGKTRVNVIAEDHHFNPQCKITPYGIFLPQYNELNLFFVSSKLTADCIVDLLENWWTEAKKRFPQIKRLVINQDNGPENHSRRTQFMNRIVNFAHNYHLDVQLAYYPPYHSKYNPVERTFGWLEQHWNGSLLDSVETVLKFAQSLEFKGKHPVVKLVKKTYQTGVKLSSKAMEEIEQRIKRLPHLPKWFVEIMGYSRE
jgi:transposase